jgi:hypothetical protein
MTGAGRFAWARSGWLPSLEVIRWRELDEARERHEEAVTAFEKAKGGKGASEALTALCRIVEQIVSSIGPVWDDPEEGWRFEYAKINGELDRYRPRIKLVPLTDRAAWEAQAADRGESDLVEPARIREALRSDYEKLQVARLDVVARPTAWEAQVDRFAVVREARGVRESLTADAAAAA